MSVRSDLEEWAHGPILTHPIWQPTRRMALRRPHGPTRIERLAALCGALAVPFVVVLWALQPEAPPAKGEGTDSVGPEVFLALGAGASLVVGTVRSVLSGWRSRTWRAVLGEVTEVRSVGGPYLYVVSRYVVDGAEHTVAVIRYGIEGVVSAYRVGKTVTVRINPKAPEEARLQPVVSPTGAIALAVGMVLVVGSAVGLIL